MDVVVQLPPNKALHLAAISLRSIAAGELSRYEDSRRLDQSYGATVCQVVPRPNRSLERPGAAWGWPFAAPPAAVTELRGAAEGASKPEPSSIPTVKELLPQLLERARRLDRDDVTRLADYCEKREIDNIEDLLTAAQLATFCSRNPTVLRLMNYLLYRRDAEDSPSEGIYYERPTGFLRPRTGRMERAADVSSVAFLQDTLQVLFGLLASTMLPARPNACHKAIVAYMSDRTDSAIVTTNYDCLIDMALEEGKLSLDYRMNFGNIPAADAGVSSRALLIKLHGSLNWYYCETCQEVQRVDIKTMIDQYVADSSPYPVIGICKECGGQRRGLLVAPLAVKFDVPPPLTLLQKEAQDAFERADVIVVVGYSFAEADTYISRMLSKSMQTNPQQRLIIVDPDDRVVSRVRRRFKASIPGFDTTRVIRACTDCVEFMPQFLKGELLSSRAPKAVAKRSEGRKSTKA
jgi:NAD-dependent SIR2 family protein deacetylase